MARKTTVTLTRCWMDRSAHIVSYNLCVNDHSKLGLIVNDILHFSFSSEDCAWKNQINVLKKAFAAMGAEVIIR